MSKVLFRLFLILCLLLPLSLPAVAAQRRRVAVLPFRNLSQQTADNWLSDSFSESLIMGMGQVPGLRLIERAEMQAIVKEQAFMQSVYANPEQAPRLGQILGAQYIALGSFQHVGDRIQAHVRLVNVETGEIEAHTLSQVQGPLDKLFELQAELAEQLVQHLSQEASRIQIQQAIDQTPSVKAHEYYIRGMSVLQPLNSAKELAAALNWFEKAIAIDPKYARAYAGLAQTYATRAQSALLYNTDESADAQAALKAAQQAQTLAPQAASTQLALSYAYGAKDQLEQALQTAYAAALRDNSGPYVRRYLTLKYAQQLNDPTQITAEFLPQLQQELQALRADPEDPLLLDLLATVYMFRVMRSPTEDHSPQLKQLQSALDANPHLVQMGFSLALMYKVLGNEAQFEAVMKKLETANKDNAMALFLLSIVSSNLRDQREWERAAALASRIIELQPDFAPAYQIRADAYQKLGKLQQAEQDIQHSIRRFDNIPDILDVAGQFYFEQGDLEKSEALFKQAQQVNQRGRENQLVDALLDYRLGQIRQKQQRWPEALHYLNQSLSRKSLQSRPRQWVSVLYARSEVAAELKQYDLAMQDMTQVMQIFKHSEEPQWRYKAYYLQRELQKQPDAAALLNDLGQVYLQLGAHEKALQQLRKAQALSPEHAVIAYNLGLAYQEAKNWPQAQKQFEKALALNADYLKARVALAQMYYNQNQIQHAEQQALFLLGQNAKDAAALELLALIREAQQRPTEALELWQLILQQDPENYRALRELRRLKKGL